MNSSCMCNSLESLGRSLDVRPGPDTIANLQPASPSVMLIQCVLHRAVLRSLVLLSYLVFLASLGQSLVHVFTEGESFQNVFDNLYLM